MMGLPGGSDPRETQRRAVARDLAARAAAREWRKESDRQLLSKSDCYRCAPKLAKYGMGLELKEERQRAIDRRAQIKQRGRELEQRLLRQRGLA